MVGVKIDGSMVNPEIYNTAWRDIASYCKYRWLSDFSYKTFLNEFTRLAAATAVPAAQALVDRLAIAGTIDDISGEVLLAPIYLVQNAGHAPAQPASDYAIVLRNADGDELSHYPFGLSEPGTVEAATMREQQEGFDPDDPNAAMTAPRAFTAFVPTVSSSGTQPSINRG